MEQKQILTRIPVELLFDGNDKLRARRGSYVTEMEIKKLLRSHRVRFVVADVGLPLRWIPQAKRFDFWKDEVRIHLATAGGAIHYEDYPGEYAYLPSLWHDDTGEPIVLLEKYH